MGLIEWLARKKCNWLGHDCTDDYGNEYRNEDGDKECLRCDWVERKNKRGARE